MKEGLELWLWWRGSGNRVCGAVPCGRVPVQLCCKPYMLLGTRPGATYPPNKSSCGEVAGHRSAALTKRYFMPPAFEHALK